MLEITPALWSAVAATCSALTAITVARIQAANRRDAARPELVLSGWSRTEEKHGDLTADIVRVTSIKNVGKGSALHVVMNCDVERAGRSVAFMGTISLPILAPGESVDINAQIHVWWQNAKDVDGVRYAPINLEILAWDSVGLRYTTMYRALAVQHDRPIFMPSEIAPGVGLGSRRAYAVPVWRLKLASQRDQAVALWRRLAGKLPPKGRTTAIVRP